MDCKPLAQSNLYVAEIAYRLGYKNAGRFILSGTDSAFKFAMQSFYRNAYKYINL